MTKAELRRRILQHLGRLAATETPTSEDAAIVDEAIDSAHSRLEHLGVAPFETSAIPAWAQIPMRDYVSGDLAGTFGLDAQARLEHKQLQQLALSQLHEQTEQHWNGQRVDSRYF